MKYYKKEFLVFIVCLLLTGCGVADVTPVDSLDFEINSEVKMQSLVKVEKDVTLVDGDTLLDTSKLGEKEVKISYKKKDKESDFTLNVKIIDTTPPLIEGKEMQEITVGEKLDFLSDVKVTDNSGEHIVPTIEGEYDVNKAGEYKLLYVAEDISGNRSEKAFALKVNAVKVKTTGYYVYKEKETWYAFRFKKNNKVDYLINFCPGAGCGGYLLEGSYKMSGSQIEATFTHLTYDVEGRKKLDKPSKWEIDIKSEKQLVYDKKKFNHQKNF